MFKIRQMNGRLGVDYSFQTERGSGRVIHMDVESFALTGRMGSVNVSATGDLTSTQARKLAGMLEFLAGLAEGEIQFVSE